MPLRRSALLAVCASVGVAGPAAAAPTLTVLKPCYVSVLTAPKIFETETVTVRGSGFTPNAQIEIALDGVPVATGVQADSAGNLPEGAVKAPIVRVGEKVFTLTATELDDAAQSAAVSSRVSELAVRIRPRRAAPSRRIRFAGSGFTDPGRPVYAHYVRRGRLRRTVRLVARPSGACGTFAVRRRQFPFSPKLGHWTVQFDQRRTYTADAPLVQISIDVKRVPRTRTVRRRALRA